MERFFSTSAALLAVSVCLVGLPVLFCYGLSVLNAWSRHGRGHT